MRWINRRAPAWFTDIHRTFGRRGFGCAGFVTLVACLSSRLVFAGLEYEPRMLADLASAHRLNGDLDAALRTADVAIDAATTRNSRIAECLARIVRARTLLASGGDESIHDELGRIKALIEETGAEAYEPLLHDLEAGLTSAARMANKPGAARRGRFMPLAS
jgi:hypothetical protein